MNNSIRVGAGGAWQRATAVLAFFLQAVAAVAAPPTYRQGEDIFIETGIEAPDRTPTFYASMVSLRHAPVFEILATRGTQGRCYAYTLSRDAEGRGQDGRWRAHTVSGRPDSPSTMGACERHPQPSA